MINLAYIAFVYILIGQIIVFLLLTLPTPSTFKSRLIRSFMGSGLRNSLMWVYLAMCVLAGIFFVELLQNQKGLEAEIQKLTVAGDGQLGSEVRIGFLAYQVQRVHRNKQITAMLIYTSLAINFYIQMLYFIYKKRGDYDGLPDPQPPTTETVTQKMVTMNINGDQQAKTANATKKASLTQSPTKVSKQIKT